MGFTDFHEYLNSKGAMQDTPKVKLVADEVDVPESKRKDAPKGVGMKNGKQPFSKDGKNVSEGKGSEKGFGDQGDKNLIYDTSKSPKPAKLPTAESFQLVHKVCDTIIENPTTLEHLVNQLGRAGLLGALVGELVGYKETFEHLAEVMAHKTYGPVVCDRFARAMKEDVAPPFGQAGGSPGGDLGGDDGQMEEPMDDGLGDDPLGGPGAGGEQVTCPHCGGDISDLVGPNAGGEDAPPPPEGDLGADGAGPLPPPTPQTQPPMAGALEHFRHSLKKSFLRV